MNTKESFYFLSHMVESSNTTEYAFASVVDKISKIANIDFNEAISILAKPTNIT
jgi:hypothetical protein